MQNQSTPLPPSSLDVASAGLNSISPLSMDPEGAQVREIKTVKAPSGEKVELGERGLSGTLIFKGIITREDYNAELIREKALWNYDVMRRSDATVNALLNAMTMPILGADWSIQAASEDDQDVMIADFIRQELFTRRVVFSDFLREALLMLPFGFSVFERVLEWTDFDWTPPPIQPSDDKSTWPTDPLTGTPKKPDPVKRKDKSMRLIGLANLASRKQRSIFKWQMDDGMPGVKQILPGANYNIPWEKLVIFTHNREGSNFEGISALRGAYKHWYLKDKMYLIDALRIEKQSLGIIELIPPDGADEEQVSDAIEWAQNLRANEMGYFKRPKGWDAHFMDMGVKGTVDPWPSIEHHDRQIVKNGLAQFLELGAGHKGSSGSKAVSQDHSELFEKSLEAVAKNLASTINNYVIKPLCAANFTGLKAYPQLDHGKIASDDIDKLATGISQLVTAGAVTPDPGFEQWLRTIMHAPDLPEGYKKDYPNRPLIKGGNTTTRSPQPPIIPPDSNSDDADGTNDDDGNNDDGGSGGNTEVTASDAIAQAKQAKARLLKLLG